ncbi:hypothetical protein [Staphylococcus pasteuri]|uniref:hypothetical protein n=1 Tax=Staphylococcus pasteuri TaxID=45972 RepID=UPI0036FE19D5
MPDIETIAVYQSNTWFQLSDEERCAIKDWLVAHDIDPREIPPSEPIVVKNGECIVYWGMTIEHSEGDMMRVKMEKNEDGEPCVVAEERTVALKTPPPQIRS